MGREQIAVKTALASPVTSEGLGIRRHTSPANHRIPHSLDVLRGEKIRGMRDLGLPGHGMLGEPGGQFLLAEGAVGEVEECEVLFLFGGNDLYAVHEQKAL